MASEEMSFENVYDDGRTTTDGRMTDACLYYKLTYEPSAQVSKKPCAEHHVGLCSSSSILLYSSKAPQNQQNDLCAKRRSAWSSAQSDQSLHCPPD